MIFTTKRPVFYSFHFQEDFWRTQTVRNIGMVDGNRYVTGNEWEAIKRKGDKAVMDWIDEQMKYKSCAIVLVGRYTASRKWVNYEIEKAWKDGRGVVGIKVHGLKDNNGRESLPGINPFESISLDNTGRPLSSVVRLFNPQGLNSQARYSWISDNLKNIVEEAINIRKNNIIFGG